MTVIYDAFEEDEIRVGIGPIGRLLVVLLGVIGLIFFLDPGAATFDLKMGGIIGIAIAIMYIPGTLHRYEEEYTLPRTLTLALIGGAVVSVFVTVVYSVPFIHALTFSTIVALGLPPIFEELIFRVGVFLSLQEVVGTFFAVIMQAVLFAAYHFIFWSPDIQYAVVLFFAGMVFQVIILMSENVLSGMIAHALLNLRPFLFVLIFSPIVVIAVTGGFIIVIWRRSRG